MNSIIASTLLFSLLAHAAGAQDRGSAASTTRTVSEIARVATPATATILAIGSGGDTVAQGSGFFIRPAGERTNVLVTNFHVLAGASRAVVVRPGGQSLEASLVLAADQGIDLAILRVAGSDGQPVLEIRDDLPEVGDRVVAIGTPLGLGQTVSEGIVSARRVLGGRDVVQITAPISPGSSGGAVLDERGRVFAVSTAHLTGGQQLNFAVPLGAGIGLLSSGKPPRSIAAVFANVPPAAQTSTDDPSDGTECSAQGFATMAVGYALGNLRQAKVWAETLFAAVPWPSSRCS